MLGSYETFKKQIFHLTQIDLSSYKENQMRRRIDSLISKNGLLSYDAYVELIRKDKEKFEQFVNYLTINVSEFYRDPDQWKYLDTVVIPELIHRFGKNLKIWSAACSTGNEPYSLVMAFSRHLPLYQIRVVATDIDKQVLETARLGLYAEKSLLHVPADLKNRFFKKVGNAYQISREIQNCVEFREHNLLKDVYPFGYHLIVCRNVLIYFTEEARDEVYRKFHRSLVKDGVLFIGTAEQMINFKELNYQRKNVVFYGKEM